MAYACPKCGRPLVPKGTFSDADDAEARVKAWKESGVLPPMTKRLHACFDCPSGLGGKLSDGRRMLMFVRPITGDNP